MKSVFFTLVLAILAALPLTAQQPGVTLCVDECVEGPPQLKSLTFDISKVWGPAGDFIVCYVTVDYWSYQVCDIEGGGCSFAIVEIRIPEGCTNNYSRKDLYESALAGFLAHQTDCSNYGGCIQNIRLYTGGCATWLYNSTTSEHVIQPCFPSTVAECCKAVYEVCWPDAYTVTVVQKQNLSSPVSCGTGGLSWEQAGQACYPVCDYFPDDEVIWVE